MKTTVEELLKTIADLQLKNDELVAENQKLKADNEELLGQINQESETTAAEREKELSESEDRFHFMANIIPQQVWVANKEGDVIYYNSVTLNFTGYTFNELRGWGWEEMIHPEDLEETKACWSRVLKTGEEFELEHRLRRKDGEYRWHLTRAVAFKDRVGKINTWIGTNTDIHDQKLSSEELRKSETYFRQLADQSPFMIWKVDEKGFCNYVNKPWINFTGMEFEESMILGWGKAFHPEDMAKEYAKFMQCFNQRKAYHSKFRIQRYDGQYRWVLAQSNPLVGVDFQGYIGSLTDITEQELAQQATRLLMQKKDEFMSIASHELKTPITSMKASLQIVQRISEKNAEVRNIHSFIEKANKQVNKLSGLVEDLLDVTKIHAGKMIFTPASFNIKDVISDCLDQLQEFASSHQIVLKGDADILVIADKHRIEQVIVNFLSNAIKYSPDADQVILTVKKEPKSVKIEVRDFGIGIPGDKADFVFDRFFRVQESSQKFSGLGLGLYISAEIIKRHGGDLGVNSVEGEGSVFWFRLPLIHSSLN
ncbi:PAS domain S-box protein [Rubrolithibacter danxiaensis]|uniref:PAS domain S-box protein n=1 Tax=Rubrolithibacter danxiaensis TaxID=3390805 RepID=UPI003BF89C5C